MAELPVKIGGTLGKYKLQRLLGSGAMGSVYLATDTLLDRSVALKTIATSYADDAIFKARFLREARTLAMLNHPNVVQIYDVYDAKPQSGSMDLGQTPFLVTEFVDGQDLHTLLAYSGALSIRRACLLTRQAALGLAAAAERTIVHRDVKPGNILVAGDLCKVTDFGLAKPLEGDQSLTQAQVVMGTPDYMAPEQAMGHAVNWRADIYALGCTMYQMLTNQSPFGKASPVQLCTAHIYEPFPLLQDKLDNVPQKLADLLAHLVEKDPQKRPSYQELVKALDVLVGPTRAHDAILAYVIVQTGPQSGMRTALGERPLVIGRLPDCDVAIDDSTASRKHAAIQHTPTGVEVRDLGSRNGIVVNGTPLRSALLHHGDQIKVGDTVVRFEIKQTSANPPSSASVLKPVSSGAFTRALSPTALEQLARQGAEGANKQEARYRRVSVVTLRVNLTGAAQLSVFMEPEDLAEKINSCLGLLIEAVFAHNGSLDSVTPDSVLAVFGAPVAIDTPAAMAVLAAKQGVKNVLKMQQDNPKMQRLGACAGLGAGPVVAGMFGADPRRDFSVIGRATEIARSLGAMARSGSILLPQDVKTMLEPDIFVVPRKDLTIKRFGEAMSIHEVVL